MKFKVVSEFKPTGDQPNAIKELVKGLNENEKYQTLLGVTGSGKTFTVANVIEEVQKPTLILAHNQKHLYPLAVYTLKRIFRLMRILKNYD